jgi:hypothetical protein
VDAQHRRRPLGHAEVRQIDVLLWTEAQSQAVFEKRRQFRRGPRSGIEIDTVSLRDLLDGVGTPRKSAAPASRASISRRPAAAEQARERAARRLLHERLRRASPPWIGAFVARWQADGRFKQNSTSE